MIGKKGVRNHIIYIYICMYIPVNVCECALTSDHENSSDMNKQYTKLCDVTKRNGREKERKRNRQESGKGTSFKSLLIHHITLIEFA